MFQWLQEIAELIGQYADLFKLIQTALLFLTAGVAFFVSRRIKTVTREVSGLVGSIDALRAQADDTVRQLNEDIDRALRKLDSRNAEDRSREVGIAMPPANSAVITQVTDPAASDLREAHRLWWQPIVDIKLPSTKVGQAKLFWKNNVRVPLNWPGTWVTVWRNDSPDGVCGVAVSGRVESVDELWKHLRPSIAILKAALPAGTTVKPGRFGISLTKPNCEFENDDERRSWMAKSLGHS